MIREDSHKGTKTRRHKKRNFFYKKPLCICALVANTKGGMLLYAFCTALFFKLSMVNCQLLIVNEKDEKR
jgi:hypothetical protein